MLKNHLRVALRAINRQRFFTFLNISGLAIAFFATLVISLYTWHEWSYDRFHDKKEQIFRLAEHSGNRVFAVTPYAWRDPLIQEFSEILDIVRIQTIGGIFRQGEKIVQESNGIVADTSIFNVFSFPLLSGNGKATLNQSNGLLVTPAMAKKYFGDEEPLGRHIEINFFGDPETFKIGGVIECPLNSHLQFDYVLPFDRVIDLNPNKSAYENWSVHFLYTYMLIQKGSDLADMPSRLNTFLDKHHGEWLSGKYFPVPEPLMDIYLQSDKEFDVQPKGNLGHLKILAAVALAVLIIGIINFVNLTTARAFTRAKSTAIRKVYGAKKVQLVRQFLLESYLITLASMILALLLVHVLANPIQDLAGKDLSALLWSNPGILLVIFISILIIGSVAGLYPAAVISSFKPIGLLQSTRNKSRVQIRARKILAIFQIAGVSVLIITTITMWYQVNFMNSKDLGYQKEMLLVLNDGGFVSGNSTKFRSFRTRLEQEPFFKEISAVSSYPGTSSHWSSRYFLEGDDQASSMSIVTFFADFNFVETMGLKVLEGRDFDEARPGDSSHFVINEACLAYFAARDSLWATDPFAQTLDWRFGNRKGKVIGVVKDFHFESLKNEIGPMIISCHLPFTAFMGVRIGSTDYDRALDRMEEIWSNLFPSVPFSYTFANDTFNTTYQAERRLGQLFMVFASLSIFVAILGLLGLSASLNHELAKEISIRKVVGTHRFDIIRLIIIQFLKLIFIANIVAIPLAYFLSNKWLEDFSYRIDWPTHVIGLSLGITCIITFSTVIYHTLRVSSINPAKVLSHG
ncbi:MAG: ABC transporter permease [Cyclobacteriaceae bacterium]|nr:ABC transporter permease [Cyclobacteriaceae bacterium HetDA_MAG_MS6]